MASALARERVHGREGATRWRYRGREGGRDEKEGRRERREGRDGGKEGGREGRGRRRWEAGDLLSNDGQLVRTVVQMTPILTGCPCTCTHMRMHTLKRTATCTDQRVISCKFGKCMRPSRSCDRCVRVCGSACAWIDLTPLRLISATSGLLHQTALRKYTLVRRGGPALPFRGALRPEP